MIYKWTKPRGGCQVLASTQDDILLYSILSCIKASNEPVGAGSIQRYLNAKEYSVGEATVGRLLRNTDDLGLTTKKSNQGRVLSKSGQIKLRELEELKWQGKWTREFIDVLDPTNKGHLIELLIARRPVEIESARLAAKNATDHDINELRNLVEEQENLARKGHSVSRIDTTFHRFIAKIGRNKVLEAIVELLRKKQEYAMGLEDVRRHAGDLYNSEHRKIFEAIEQRDVDMAILAMKRHLNNLMHRLEDDC
jgi:hypothetical protein